MTRRSARKQLRRQGHQHACRHRDKLGLSKVPWSDLRAEATRQRKIARLNAPAPTGRGATPKRRFLLPHLLPTATDRRYPMAKQFLAPLVASGPRGRKRAVHKSYYADGLILPRPAPPSDIVKACRKVGRLPHGRPRGTK